MNIYPEHTIKTDVLIIGSGLGGLWAAYGAKEYGAKHVTIVDKASIADSSQSKLSAGATIYLRDKDSFLKWKTELVDQQSGLSKVDMVEEMLKASNSKLQKQLSWGLYYENLPWKSPVMKVGGAKHLKMHTLARYKGQKGGSALINVIKDKVTSMGVDVLSKIMITQLLIKENKTVGAIGFNRITGETYVFQAKAVILATADCSFRNTGCIGQATGDGYALAYDAGARLTNMEHWGSNTGSPTKSFESISDVAASIGCKFYNNKMESFTHKYTDDGDKSEPYKIAQAMADEAARTGEKSFYFDMTRLPWRLAYKHIFKKQMSGYLLTMFHAMDRDDQDWNKTPIEWAPIMRTIRGGIRSDIHCMSDVEGLFVAGVAQALDPAGLNGYSTMRAMWSGEKSGQSAARYCKDREIVEVEPLRLQAILQKMMKPMNNDSRITADEVIKVMQSILFPSHVSLRKEEKTLKLALKKIVEIEKQTLDKLYAKDAHELAKVHEVKNMLISAKLYLEASLMRKESRGDHYRIDYPKTDNVNWLKWINLKKGEQGNICIEFESVTKT